MNRRLVGSTVPGKGKMRPQHPIFSLSFCASGALVLTLITAFIQLGIATSYSIPLALLIGLASQHMFRLSFDPRNSDVLQPTTLVCAYFLTDFALRAFYLGAFP